MYQNFKTQLRIVIIVLAIMVILQLLNSMTMGWVSQFGIRPREFSGLMGIAFAPLIHHGWFHLLSNLLPMAILMLLVAQMGSRVLWQASLGIVLIGGLAVWLLASSGVHAGASGLIFGYWGFLLAYAWFDRNLKNLLIAMLVILLYGGMFVGFLYVRPHVSWASHLYGALAGVFMAWWLSKGNRAQD